jgi:hypothetical protein
VSKFVVSKLIVVLAVVMSFAVPMSLSHSVQTSFFKNVTGNQVDANSWTRTELFFGSSTPGGGAVTEQQFKTFVDREVTPRFPQGLTLLSGYGQFRDSHGFLQQERSMLLILVYPRSSDTSSKIEQIRDAYKSEFRQESVLRIDSGASVAF